MNLKPVGDRIIIKQDEATETTSSGLFIATEAKERPSSGVVLAVGPGKTNKDGICEPLPVAVGDRIIYGKFAGTEVNLDDETVIILNADDVFAVFEG